MLRNSLYIGLSCIIVIALFCSGCAQKTPEELYTLATEAHHAGQTSKALKNYQKIVDKCPDNAHAFKAGFMASHLASDTTDKSVAASDKAYQQYFFNEAQQLQVDGKFDTAVTFYEKFLTEYPDNEHAYKAQFMIGFIFNESLKDTTKARAAFGKVINNYPQNDLTDDATWMIENLNKGPEEIITGDDK